MDLSKHITIFNPQKLKGAVLMLGVGAVGSALALEIAKLGVDRMTLMDDDTVEEQNLSNQVIYGPGDVGNPKVISAVDNIHDLTGFTPNPDKRKWKGWKLKFETVLLLCGLNGNTQGGVGRSYLPERQDHFIDCRITARTVIVYGFDPSDVGLVDAYRETLYADEEVPPGAGGCNITQSIGATAHIAASIATWLLINHVAGQTNAHEVIMDIARWTMHSRLFSTEI